MAVSVTSKSTASTTSAPAALARPPPRTDVGCRARRGPRCGTGSGPAAATMAWAISEEPPSTSTDWGRPMASIIDGVRSLLSGWDRAVSAFGAGCAASPDARRRPGEAGLPPECPPVVAQSEAPPEVGTEDAVGIDPVTHGLATRRSAGTWPGTAPGRPASPWPGRHGRRPDEHLVVEVVEQHGRAGGAHREVEGQGPAGHGEGEGPGSPGPNRLSTARNEASFTSVRRSMIRGAPSLCARRAPRTGTGGSLSAVEAVPARHPVEGVEEAGHVVGSATWTAGSLAEPELVEGAHGERIEQAARRRQGDPGQAPGHEGTGPIRVAPQLGGRSSSRAWSPRVSTERPSRLPVDWQSIQATE
jgi:hypothetical protein